MEIIGPDLHRRERQLAIKAEGGTIAALHVTRDVRRDHFLADVPKAGHEVRREETGLALY